MRTYSVSLTEDAESDIAELMAFYDELVDEESATKFFEEAMATISKLQEFPHANSSLKEYPEAHRVRMIFKNLNGCFTQRKLPGLPKRSTSHRSDIYLPRCQRHTVGKTEGPICQETSHPPGQDFAHAMPP